MLPNESGIRSPGVGGALLARFVMKFKPFMAIGPNTGVAVSGLVLDSLSVCVAPEPETDVESR